MTLDQLERVELDQLHLLFAWAQGALLLFLGLVLGTFVSRLVGRAMENSWSPQHALLVRRATFWGLLGLFGASALKAVGFDLSVLLGAAGLVSVAVGFASQTSASNIVSGAFLLAERPFAVGDVVRLGETQGTVLSIDLLSVKLRTFDNLFVRVPNETVMKSQIVNVSRFPVRRFDLVLRFAPGQPLEKVRNVLLEAADRCRHALDEPRPTVIFLGHVESGVEMQLSAWSVQLGFMDLRNTLPQQVDDALREAGISMGYPHRRVQIEGAMPPPSQESAS